MNDYRKIYVLDTNVYLNDHSSLFKFLRDNKLIIPGCVIEEIDANKKGREEKAVQARAFSRVIDVLTKEGKEAVFNGGYSVVYNEVNYNGLISIKYHPIHNDLKEKGFSSNNDNLIISSAYTLQKENPEKEVILVSMDVNVRIKARSIGVKAEEVKYNSASEETLAYEGIKELHDDVLMSKLFESIKSKKYCDDVNIISQLNLSLNEYLTIGDKLYQYDGERLNFIPQKKSKLGIKPKNIEQRAALHAMSSDDFKLVILNGPAGTGKTYLSVFAATDQVIQGNFENISISRRELATEDEQGFLPGTQEEKLNPYLGGFMDNLKQIKKDSEESDKIDDLAKDIEKLSLAYIRGRSISNTYFILDEAQNLTPHLMKTLMTRLGKGTKIIVMGDINQIDDKYLSKHNNGLAYLMEKMSKEKIVATITLNKVERSELAALSVDKLN